MYRTDVYDLLPPPRPGLRISHLAQIDDAHSIAHTPVTHLTIVPTIRDLHAYTSLHKHHNYHHGDRLVDALPLAPRALRPGRTHGSRRTRQRRPVRHRRRHRRLARTPPRPLRLCRARQVFPSDGAQVPVVRIHLSTASTTDTSLAGPSLSSSFPSSASSSTGCLPTASATTSTLRLARLRDPSIQFHYKTSYSLNYCRLHRWP